MDAYIIEVQDWVLRNDYSGTPSLCVHQLNTSLVALCWFWPQGVYGCLEPCFDQVSAILPQQHHWPMRMRAAGDGSQIAAALLA